MTIKQNCYELQLFGNLKNSISILVDIGCRDNIDYYHLHPNAEIHLFDINQKHIDKIARQISSYDHKIRLYNFGLSNKNAVVTYSQISESIHRQWGEHVLCNVRKFDEVLFEKQIKNIDFLKMDIEGCEPEILSYLDIIKGINFVQFEYGETWSRPQENLKKIIDEYTHFHKFYFLKDINHPLSNTEFSPTLTPIDNVLLQKIESYTDAGAGCNILMVKRDIAFDYKNV